MRQKITPILLFILMTLSCLRPETIAEHVQPGEKLPEFNAELLDGTRICTEDMTGQYSLIILFSTTCPDCINQLPEIQKFHDAEHESVKVLGINRGEKKEIVRTFLEKNNYTFPVCAPEDRSLYDIFDRQSGSGVPQIYISNPDGVVTFYADDSRVISERELEGLIIIF